MMRAVQSGRICREALAALKYRPNLHFDNLENCFPSALTRGALATALESTGQRQ